MKTFLSYVSSFRQRAFSVFHRTDQVKGVDQAKADSAERRERWDQVISEHRKPHLPHP